MQPNNEYDPFARAYNRHWGADYRAEAMPIVERHVLSRLRPGAPVLDVCCGTGQVTAEVRRRGFHLTGIDASANMIHYARLNVPDAEFAVADVRDFRLDARFQGAYCVFESLNHVPDLEGIGKALARVRFHLEPGAPFLFDLNQEEAFIEYWNNTDAIVDDDSVVVLRSNYDEETRFGTCDITDFLLSEGEWRRNDFTVHQTCHDVDSVTDELRQAGFEDVSLYHARDAGMKGDAGFARVFFLAIA